MATYYLEGWRDAYSIPWHPTYQIACDGDLEALKQMDSNCTLMPIAAAYGALDNNHGHVVDWLIESKQGTMIENILVYHAVKEGDMEMLKSFVERGCDFGPSFYERAQKYGRAQMIEYAVEAGHREGLKLRTWLSYATWNLTHPRHTPPS